MIVYENVQTRDLRGTDATTGVIVEISAANVKGKFLSDVLAAVDMIVERVRQDALVTSNTAQSITTISPPTTNRGSRTVDDDGEDVVMAEAPIQVVAAVPNEGTPGLRRNPRRDRKPTRKLADG